MGVNKTQDKKCFENLVAIVLSTRKGGRNTSGSITFTVGTGGFTYNGEDWAVDLNSKGISGKDCNNVSTTPPYYSLCTAILTGTNTATLGSCDTGSTYLNCIPIPP